MSHQKKKNYLKKVAVDVVRVINISSIYKDH